MPGFQSLRSRPFLTTAIQNLLTFGFHEFLSTRPKLVYLINSFVKYSHYQCPETRMATPIFDHTHQNIFQSTFNFHESVSTCKKSGFFIILFQRCSQFKNHAILLAKSILAPKNQIFPKNGVSARIQQIIRNFFIDQIQKKLMTKFSFSSFLGPKKKKKMRLCQLQHHMGL